MDLPLVVQEPSQRHPSHPEKQKKNLITCQCRDYRDNHVFSFNCLPPPSLKKKYVKDNEWKECPCKGHTDVTKTWQTRNAYRKRMAYLFATHFLDGQMNRKIGHEKIKKGGGGISIELIRSASISFLMSICRFIGNSFARIVPYLAYPFVCIHSG